MEIETFHWRLTENRLWKSIFTGGFLNFQIILPVISKPSFIYTSIIHQSLIKETCNLNISYIYIHQCLGLAIIKSHVYTSNIIYINVYNLCSNNYLD